MQAEQILRQSYDTRLASSIWRRHSISNKDTCAPSEDLVSLCIWNCTGWSVFAVCRTMLWLLGYPQSALPAKTDQIAQADLLIVLGFNDTSTLVGHFVSSPREREKNDRRDSRRDEREEQGRKRNRNESEETEEIKTFPLNPYLLQG